MPESPSTMTPSMTTILNLLSPGHAATSAELSERGRIGRSTASKTLAALEAKGLARRVSDERPSGVRSPDLWFAATPGEAAQPEPATREAGCDGAEFGTGLAAESEARENDAPRPATEAGTRVPEPEHPSVHVVPQDGDRADPAPTVTAASNGADAATAPQAEPAAPGRLAKGGLRDLVAEHLTAHPDEEFTAPKLSKILKRSSGAISNVFDALVKTGEAEMTSERPRRFRHLAAHPGR